MDGANGSVSGSLSSGMLHMPFLALSLLSPSNVQFTRFSSLCSCHGSSNMTRPTAHGGREDGMGVD